MENILNYINVPVFLASFAFGIFAVYIFSDESRTIVVHPSPDNIDSIQYKDKANNCFQFKQSKVQCNVDNNKEIKKVPVQN